jgi:hypothetical protein
MSEWHFKGSIEDPRDEERLQRQPYPYPGGRDEMHGERDISDSTRAFT